MTKRLSSRIVLGTFVVSMLSFVAVFAGSGGAATNGRSAATGSATFTDPLGDAGGGAPDVTTVALSDDATTGTITIQVTAVGFASASEQAYPTLTVFVDTDRNPSTGDPDNRGTDRHVVAQRQPGGRAAWALMQWNGNAWVSAVPAAGDKASYIGDVQTWTINKSDLGGPTGFGLVAATFVFDGDNVSGMDVAPNDGTWSYDLSTTPTPPPPANAAPVARLAVSPSSVTAGQTVSFDGSASSDADGRIVSFAWSFGDGTTASGATATHAYASGGTYVVTLVVTDDDGATGSASQSLVVTAPAPPPPAAPAVKAVIGPPSTSPANALAGKRFTAPSRCGRATTARCSRRGR
jgi:PKD repeat protein